MALQFGAIVRKKSLIYISGANFIFLVGKFFQLGEIFVLGASFEGGGFFFSWGNFVYRKSLIFVFGANFFVKGHCKTYVDHVRVSLTRAGNFRMVDIEINA